MARSGSRPRAHLLPCVALSLALVAPGCGLWTEPERSGAHPAIRTPTPRTGEGRVVIVTIDGARWQDVFFGADPRFGLDVTPAKELLPNLYALTTERGIRIGGEPAPCGEVRTANDVNLSLPGYLEAFTGRPSNCLDNDCPRSDFTLFDQAAQSGVPGVFAIGSWEALTRATTSSPRNQGAAFVSAGRTWPREPHEEPPPLDRWVADGIGAEPWPGIGLYRPDLHTARIALETFRLKRPGLLYVGLGDTDEYGHHGSYADYAAALRLADTFIGDLAAAIAAQDAWAHTTVLVFPDHGRAASFRDHGVDFPESGRIFLFAFGAGVARLGATNACPTHDITLLDIAPTVRALLGLVADPSADAGRPIAEVVGASSPVQALSR